MLKFFKNLMSKQPKEAEISLDEIPAFIEEHTSSTRKGTELLVESSEKLTVLFSQLKSHLKDLERADLKNKEVDKRVLNLMEGNRVAYIKKAEIFVNSCKFPESGTPDAIKDYIEKYKSNVDFFNKNTSKAFYILKEFFGDNVKLIGQTLKQIDDTILVMHKSTENTPTLLISKINQLLLEINDVDKKEASIKDEIKSKEEELQLLKEELKEISNMISIKKKSDAFLSVSSRTEEKERCEDEIKEIENTLIQDFSPLVNPLRKLNHISEDKIIDNYIENPFHALKTDKDFAITKFLKSLKIKIESDEIQIKDKKRDSSLQAIEKLTHDYLSKTLHRLSEIESRKKELNSTITSNSTIREISEMTYKEDHLLDKIKRKDEEIVSLKKGLAKYDKTNLIKDIENDLLKLTSINVTLTH